MKQRQVSNMEDKGFSQFVSELTDIAEEVASLSREVGADRSVFMEFSFLVDKFVPFFNELRENSIVFNKPSFRKAIRSLEEEFIRAKALINGPSLEEPVKQIDDIAHDFGRSLGLLLLSSLEMSVILGENIFALQRQCMNARFSGSSSPSSSRGSDIVGCSNSKIEKEIQEERVSLDKNETLLKLKYGDEEELSNAIFNLKDFIMHEKVDNDWINEGGVITILFHRLSSSRSVNRLATIMTLRTLAQKFNEEKEKIADAEFLTAVVKSLTRDEGERREAVGLLLELSDLPAVRRRIGRIQGCIVMLVAILNGDDPIASHNATKLLNALSSSAQNALHMAEAGHFKPLVQYLKEGSDMNKILMATALSRMELTDECRASLGNNGAIECLVNMFNSGKLESKLSALNALQNLSSLTENVKRLTRSSIVVSLFQLLFSVTSVLMTIREPASVILARIAKSEVVLVNPEVTQQMLSLLNLSSPVVQCHLLEALDSIAAHPSASKVRNVMKEKGALQLILPFLMESNIKIRANALNLLYTLSNHIPQELTEHMGVSHLRDIVHIISSSTWDIEKVAAIGILSNLPVRDKNVTDILKRENLLPTLITLVTSSTEDTTTTILLEENVAGVLIRFTIPSDKKSQLFSAEHRVIPLLVKFLSSGSSVTKCRAAVSLTQLSQNTLSLRKPRKSIWPCMPPSAGGAYCEVHDGYCFINRSFCIVKAGAISPLIQILECQDREADEAALSVIATLLQDEIWGNGANFLAKMSFVQALIKVLEVGNVKAQEKALWILERIFRVEELRVEYGESAQVVLIDLTQKGDARLKPAAAKILSHLELLQVQSSYF